MGYNWDINGYYLVEALQNNPNCFFAGKIAIVTSLGGERSLGEHDSSRVEEWPRIAGLDTLNKNSFAMFW